MDAAAALAFVRERGVVLVSARGPVPTLTEAVAGEAIRGSWWGHRLGRAIFAVLAAVGDADDVLTCRLVDAKLTLVHRRLWPALAAAASHFPPARLCRIRQRHTASGKHVNDETAFPDWVPADVADAALALAPDAALALLGDWTRAPRGRDKRRE